MTRKIFSFYNLEDNKYDRVNNFVDIKFWR